MSRHAERERLLELLAERAFEPLSALEQAELEGLLAAHPDVDPDALDRVAATLDAASVPDDAALPPGLGDRIARDAEAFFAGPAARVEAPRAARRGAPPRRASRLLPWLAAAAAAAALAWVLLAPPAPAPTALERRDALLAAREDAFRSEWAPVGDPTGADASGDVVWSDAAQQGFMRFRGLAANDPDVEQYQLWIFDGTRSDEYPVDGGVFDVASDGEVVVPIDAKLPVGRAWQFAVTVERPGGVVVSDRSRIALLAAR